jgi:hypothetical protein
MDTVPAASRSLTRLALLARTSLIATLASALVSVALLLAQVDIFLLHHPPLQLGDLAATALKATATVGTGLGIVSSIAGLVLRRINQRLAHAEQQRERVASVAGGIADQLQGAPEQVDRLSRGQGCAFPITVGVLGVSIVVATITYVPAHRIALAINNPVSSAPAAGGAMGALCHPPAPPAGFFTLTSAAGACWNYPRTWSILAGPAGQAGTVVAPNAQDYFTVFETTLSAFNALTPFRTRQTAVEIGQSVLGWSGTQLTITNDSTVPPQTTVMLGAHTWTEMDTAPNFTLTRGGTTFDVTLLLTRHASINFLVILMAPRATASAAFTTVFQPMLQSLTLVEPEKP